MNMRYGAPSQSPVFGLLLACVIAAASAPAPAPVSLSAYLPRAFALLPCHERVDADLDASFTSPASLFPPDGEAYVRLIDAYLAAARNVVARASAWPLDSPVLIATAVPAAFAPAHAPPALLPHVARVDTPLNSTVFLFGDLHGSLLSLARTLWAAADDGTLDPATLRLAPHVFMLFLGDYVDRGAHGVETLGLLLALKAANPYAVFLARGNHEDVRMNVGGAGGFAAEISRKFHARGAASRVLSAVARVYDTLPMAIYLGGSSGSGGGERAARHVQCCHGGVEVGFDPSAFLAVDLEGSVGEAAPVMADEVGTPANDLHSALAVAFALVHGFGRGTWFERLQHTNASLAVRFPRDVIRLLTNVGAPMDAPRPRRAVKPSVEVDIGTDGEATTSDITTQADADWLAAVRAARSRAAETWGREGGHAGSVWPVEPLGTDPASGMMWADFLTDDTQRPVHHSHGRGLGWGLAPTDAVLRSSNLVSIFRAHQHNNAPGTGAMLDRVIDGGGMYDNWHGSGHALTFLSGAHIPGLGWDRTAYGLLHLPSGDARTWTLELCSHKSRKPLMGSAPLQPELAALGGEEEWVGGKGADTVCDASHDFTCVVTPWVAVV